MQLAQSPRPCSRLHRLARLAASAALALGTAATALALRAPTPTDTNSGQATTHARLHQVPSGVMAGQVLTQVPPVYPPKAKEANLEGSVRLVAIIDAQGTIQHLTAVSGPAELRRSALDAVRQWTYKPYLLNGEPTSVQTTITVNYSLKP